MFNHSRGLWGYTGTAGDGQPLTIQSTGMGGPSAAIVTTELAQLGAQRVIRVGTCGALDPSLELGALLVVTEALAADGASRALGAGERVAPDLRLLRALRGAGQARGALVASTDLFYGGHEQALRDAGAQAVEMETAALFTLAATLELAAGSVVIVSDLIFPKRVRIAPAALAEAERRAGQLAASALTTEMSREAGSQSALSQSRRNAGTGGSVPRLAEED